jgi:hypothetical protein
MRKLLTILFLSWLSSKGQAPTVNAGSSQNVTLRTTSITLSGSASGNGGHTIVSHAWYQDSGPNTGPIINFPPYGEPNLFNGFAGNQMTNYFNSTTAWLSQATPFYFKSFYGVGARTLRLCVDPISTWVPSNFDSLNQARMPTLDSIMKIAWSNGYVIIIDFTHDLDGGLHVFDSAYNFTSTYRAGGPAGGFRRYQRALYNHIRSIQPNHQLWAFEIWNEPKDPGSANVQSECYDLQDSVVMDLHNIDSTCWIIVTGTGSTAGLAGMNYHLATAYKVPKLPYSHIIYNFHGYLPAILTFIYKQSANDQGNFPLRYDSLMTQPQSQQVTDSLNTFDMTTANGLYDFSGIGTKGEVHTYGYTQPWNKHFQDSTWGNGHQTGINYNAPMICTEKALFQYGNGYTGSTPTGIQRGYRLNFYDDINHIMTKDSIAANEWDPNGVAVRLDSNQSVTAPIWDSTLLYRMGWLGRASITDSTNYGTTITNLNVAGTYVFRLVATDNAGNTSFDTMTVVVSPSAPPTANAGPDQSIRLPKTSTTLDGTGSTGATTYAWTNFSGPNTPTITNANTATPTVSGLINGTYVFTLTVNSVATDQISVFVSNCTCLLFNK